MIAWLAESLASLALAPGAFAAVMAVVFGASVLRGFTGFGFAIAAVPLLGLMMSPTQAVALALGLQLLGGLTDFPRASRHCHWPSLKWLVAGAIIGSPAGILLLSIAPASVGRITIGTITLIAAVVLGRGVTLAAFPGRVATLVAGLHRRTVQRAGGHALARPRSRIISRLPSSGSRRGRRSWCSSWPHRRQRWRAPRSSA